MIMTLKLPQDLFLSIRASENTRSHTSTYIHMHTRSHNHLCNADISRVQREDSFIDSLSVLHHFQQVSGLRSPFHSPSHSFSLLFLSFSSYVQKLVFCYFIGYFNSTSLYNCITSFTSTSILMLTETGYVKHARYIKTHARIDEQFCIPHTSVTGMTRAHMDTQIK